MPTKIPLPVVRRVIVMGQAQTLPPRQAVLKMAGEFILDPLMHARNSCMLSSDIQQSNPDDLYSSIKPEAAYADPWLYVCMHVCMYVYGVSKTSWFTSCCHRSEMSSE